MKWSAMTPEQRNALVAERVMSEIDELAMVDRGDEQRWTQSTTGQLTPDDILAAWAALPDEPRAQTAYDAPPAYSVDPYKAKLTPRFEHIYNADGTCHAANCGAPGLILAFDEFSPEIAQWFCGMHWNDCTAKELLTVAEDLRRPMASLFGGTYEVRESSPGVFTHTWDMATPEQNALYDKIREGGITVLSIRVHPQRHAGRLWHRYCRKLARRARDVRLRQRARARYRRHDRAVFRRRKRGLA